MDLASFYPLLAVIMEVHRLHPLRPPHPALTQTILNAPNPGRNDVCNFPDGSSATLILLGDSVSLEDALCESPRRWWPAGETDQIRRKLARRFLYEGFLLPSVVATLVALLAEMYSTTYVPASEAPDGQRKRRVRLTYGNAAIIDFGIAKGSVNVKAQDHFAYYSIIDNTFIKGTNPKEHYWMYFTTTSGESFYLDCGMFTYNFCLMIGDTSPYARHGLPPGLGGIPAFFESKEIKRNAPALYEESERFSVLRDGGLQSAVRHSKNGGFSDRDFEEIYVFMKTVKGRECRPIEKHLAKEWCITSCAIMGLNIAAREYMRYPPEPILGTQKDPDERDMPPGEDWMKRIKRWAKKQRRGEITTEQLSRSFRRWEEKHGSA